jgi:hypothetical protein
MATFTVQNPVTSQSVRLDLSFNLNPLGANVWTIIGGDAATLPAASGVWNSDGIQNVLVIRESSQKEVLRLDPIDVNVSLSDPFQGLNPGDAGDGLFVAGDVASWTFDSH